MKVINLFGAPSAGKSTAMLGLTYKMKILGYNVENTPEYFKEVIYEEGKPQLFGGQLLVLAEQNKRLARLADKVDYAITDCPLPLIAFYTPDDYVAGFKDFALNLNEHYDNINIFINRNHTFEKEKRIHNESQANIIEKELPIFLNDMGIPFYTVESGEHSLEAMLDIIKKQHKSQQPKY